MKGRLPVHQTAVEGPAVCRWPDQPWALCRSTRPEVESTVDANYVDMQTRRLRRTGLQELSGLHLAGQEAEQQKRR